jgi:hypothetical protein
MIAPRTLADYLRWLVSRHGLDPRDVGSIMLHAIRHNYIATTPEIPHDARVHAMAGGFVVETADAIIPAERFDYRRLKSQDYLRADYCDERDWNGVDMSPVTTPPPGQTASPAKPAAKPRSKAWDKILPHFDREVAKHGPFANRHAAAKAVSAWIGKKRIAFRTLERGILLYRPHWIKP